MRRLPFLIGLVGIAAVAVVGAIFLLAQQDNPQPEATGEALIGGPFTLVDGDGQTVTNESFDGEWRLIYFGYTYCPDVCPTELALMGQAMDLLPEETAEKVRPIFITIDPERDTPKAVGQYVENFHSRMVGLSGTPEQIAAVAKAYRVYYKRVDQAGSSDYLMDHSSIIYLMDEQGRFVTHFSYGTSAEALAAGIEKAVG